MNIYVLPEIKILKLMVKNECPLINPSVTENYMYLREVKIDDNLWKNKIKIINKKTNECSNINYNMSKSKYTDGLEDLRITEFNNKLWFSAVYKNEKELFSTIIGYFNDEITKIDKIVIDFATINNNNHVKNIVPLVYDNKIYYIDFISKTMYNIDENTSNLTTYTLESDLNIPKIKGSTEIIHLNDTIYGGIVHNQIIVHTGDSMKRYYYFYWIEIDMFNKKIVKISNPFIFKNFGTVFISGIYLSNDVLDLYYSENDNDIYCGKCDINFIRKCKSFDNA